MDLDQTTGPKKYTCRISHKVFDSFEEYQKHIKSDLYRFNIKRKAVGLPPITQEQWEVVQQEKKEKDNYVEPKKTSHIKSKNIDKNEKRKKRNKVRSEQYEKNLTKDEGKSVDQLIDEHIQERKPIEINHSLFCGHVSSDMESNLEFMRKNYGFIIPMSSYCNDKPGLLKYLGEKIGVGNTAIYDNLQFRSTEACQNHMRDTDTCKMLWEDNEHEYEAFYDFKAMIEKEKKNG